MNSFEIFILIMFSICFIGFLAFPISGILYGINKNNFNEAVEQCNLFDGEYTNCENIDCVNILFKQKCNKWICDYNRYYLDLDEKLECYEEKEKIERYDLR